MRVTLFQGEFEEEPGFPLTPLIDMIFLLLIFYVSVSHIQQIEEIIGIRVPTAKSGTAATKSLGEAVINVDPEGNVRLNNQQLGINELQDRLYQLSQIAPGQSVVIRSDQKTDWLFVSKVLDICNLAGIQNIKFAVLPEKQGKR